MSSRSFMLGTALAGILVSGLCAQPAPVPEADSNTRVCSSLRDEIVAAASGLNERRLNVFLFDAAGKGCVSVATSLLERGASIQASDRNGSTALLHAAGAGHDNVVRLLLDRGADLEHADLKGDTALSKAVTGNHRRVVELLLERGARPDPVGGSGVTPLTAAAFNGSERIVKRLLEAGADPAQMDASGKGPMIYASARGFAPIVSALLEAGVDPNRAYGHNLTALMWAAGHPNDVPEPEGLEVVEMLVGRGASLDPVDDRGRSALMIAAGRDHPQIVRWLLEHGADPALRDKEGKTAADLAASDAVREALKAAPKKS